MLECWNAICITSPTSKDVQNHHKQTKQSFHCLSPFLVLDLLDEGSTVPIFRAANWERLGGRFSPKICSQHLRGGSTWMQSSCHPSWFFSFHRDPPHLQGWVLQGLVIDLHQGFPSQQDKDPFFDLGEVFFESFSFSQLLSFFSQSYLSHLMCLLKSSSNKVHGFERIIWHAWHGAGKIASSMSSTSPSQVENSWYQKKQVYAWKNHLLQSHSINYCPCSLLSQRRFSACDSWGIEFWKKQIRKKEFKLKQAHNCQSKFSWRAVSKGKAGAATSAVGNAGNFSDFWESEAGIQNLHSKRNWGKGIVAIGESCPSARNSISSAIAAKLVGLAIHEVWLQASAICSWRNSELSLLECFTNERLSRVRGQKCLQDMEITDVQLENKNSVGLNMSFALLQHGVRILPLLQRTATQVGSETKSRKQKCEKKRRFPIHTAARVCQEDKVTVPHLSTR